MLIETLIKIINEIPDNPKPTANVIDTEELINWKGR